LWRGAEVRGNPDKVKIHERQDQVKGESAESLPVESVQHRKKVKKKSYGGPRATKRKMGLKLGGMAIYQKIPDC